MRFHTFKFIFLVLIAGLFLNACFDTNSGNTSERFLYTSTNNTAGNEVIRFSIQRDGDLSATTAGYPTGGFGDAGDGDFDSQGALITIDDYLLVVNAGEHGSDVRGTVSVMKINPTDGRLEQTTMVSSMGIRPVSMSSIQEGNTHWVLVGNQDGNPLCDRRRSSQDICDTPATSAERNIALFRFDAQKGTLTFVTILLDDDVFDNGEAGGVSQIAFSPDKKKLALSTWGVALLQSHSLADIQGNSDLANGFRESFVKVWNVRATETTLTLSHNRNWSKEGVSGSIGFKWGSNSRYIYQTSFSVPQGTSTVLPYSVVVLDSDSNSNTTTTLTLVDQAGTRKNDGVNSNTVTTAGTTIQPDQACWAALSPNGRYLYTASFNANIISFFNVNPERNTITFNNIFKRKNYRSGASNIPIPAEDTKDIFIPRDGTFLYVLGAFKSHTISYYAIGGDGRLTEHANSPLTIYPDANPSHDEQAFLGLTGY